MDFDGDLDEDGDGVLDGVDVFDNDIDLDILDVDVMDIDGVMDIDSVVVLDKVTVGVTVADKLVDGVIEGVVEREGEREVEALFPQLIIPHPAGIGHWNEFPPTLTSTKFGLLQNSSGIIPFNSLFSKLKKNSYI